MRFLNLLKPSYYFDSNLAYLAPGIWLVLGIALGLIVGSFYLHQRWGKSWQQERFLRGVYSNFYRASLLLGWGMLGWLFFRFEAISGFNLRLWPALLGLYFALSLLYFFYFLFFRYPPLAARKKEGHLKKRFFQMARRRKRS